MGDATASPQSQPEPEPLGPGIHDIPAERYHADPCPAPSLSSSLIQTITTLSPLHAMHMHPRLAPEERKPEPWSREMSIGSAAHLLALGKGPRVAFLDFPDWRKKEARDARDAAIAEGKIVMKAIDRARVEDMNTALREQLARHEAVDAFMLGAGRAEMTLIWRERELWCRALVDWLPNDPEGWIYDYKTTSQVGEPWAFARRIPTLGYDIQAAWYLRGAAHARDKKPRGFRWVVQETEPPYAVAVIEAGESTLHLGTEKLRRAMALWERCLRHGQFPGYPTHVVRADAPAWAAYQWDERKAVDEGTFSPKLAASDFPFI